MFTQKRTKVQHERKRFLAFMFLAVTIAGLAQAQGFAQTGRVTYKTVKIDGLDIFYREAGSPANPTVLLLHGFPTSSQMFRNLMPQLADRYHVTESAMSRSSVLMRGRPINTYLTAPAIRRFN